MGFSINDVKLAWTICMPILEITCETSDSRNLENSLSFEAAILVDHEFGAGFEISAVLVAVLERVYPIIVTHLVYLPHTHVLIAICKGHFTSP